MVLVLHYSIVLFSLPLQHTKRERVNYLFRNEINYSYFLVIYIVKI